MSEQDLDVSEVLENYVDKLFLQIRIAILVILFAFFVWGIVDVTCFSTEVGKYYKYYTYGVLEFETLIGALAFWWGCGLFISALFWFIGRYVCNLIASRVEDYEEVIAKDKTMKRR
jgi:hypothetical protein